MTERNPARPQHEVSAAIECAIGLNVDCGGAEGVYRVRDAVLDAIRPEMEMLAALRQVARGYCPACGRGDAAPTVTDWEQQKQRADQAEAAAERVRALHRPAECANARCKAKQWCIGCDPDGLKDDCSEYPYPCPTILALDHPDQQEQQEQTA